VGHAEDHVMFEHVRKYYQACKSHVVWELEHRGGNASALNGVELGERNMQFHLSTWSSDIKSILSKAFQQEFPLPKEWVSLLSTLYAYGWNPFFRIRSKLGKQGVYVELSPNLNYTHPNKAESLTMDRCLAEMKKRKFEPREYAQLTLGCTKLMKLVSYQSHIDADVSVTLNIDEFIVHYPNLSLNALIERLIHIYPKKFKLFSPLPRNVRLLEVYVIHTGYFDVINELMALESKVIRYLMQMLSQYMAQVPLTSCRSMALEEFPLVHSRWLHLNYGNATAIEGESMVAKLKSSLKASVETSQVMDKITQSRVLNQLSRVHIHFGVPEFGYSPSTIYNFYKHVVFSASNQMNLRSRQLITAAITEFGFMHDQWRKAMFTSYALYDRFDNVIRYPMVLLTDPRMAVTELPLDLAYSGFGLSLSNALLSTIQPVDTWLDSSITHHSKWTEFSELHLYEQYQCWKRKVINAKTHLNLTFEVFPISYAFYDQQAIWITFKTWERERSDEKLRHPGGPDGFFLNLAQTFCSNINVNTTRTVQYRVNTMMQYFNSFSETFQCSSTEGSQMDVNNATTCAIF
jgi:hypothetical protein